MIKLYTLKTLIILSVVRRGVVNYTSLLWESQTMSYWRSYQGTSSINTCYLWGVMPPIVLNSHLKGVNFMASTILKSKSELAGEIPISTVIESLFSQPRIIGLCSDVSQGKSNLLYYIIDYLKNNHGFTRENLYSYALPIWLGEQKIYSVEELELIENSIIIIDEFFLFLDLDDRKRVKQLKVMLQRIKHSNNVLILSGLADNFNKFISSQLEIKIYKQTTIKNLINGSPMKDAIVSYNGREKGSTVLKLGKEQALIHGLGNASHYDLVNIPYMKEYDIKRNLPDILTGELRK